MIFRFVSNGSILHIDLNEIQTISGLTYREEEYAEDSSDNGCRKNYFVGAGRSHGNFTIQLRGHSAPIKILHTGERLKDKALAEKSARDTLTEEEKRYETLHISKIAKHMNKQPNIFEEGRKFKADYEALVAAWYKSRDLK